MTFSDMSYKRPDTEQLEVKLRALIEIISKATSLEEINKAIQEFNRLRSHYETMDALVYLKHFGNLKDEFFKKEFEYLTSFEPTYSGLKSTYYQVLVVSPWRAQLEENWGKQLFTIAELTINTYSDEIKEDLLEEGKLVAHYHQLMNSIKVNFNEKVMSLGQLAPFLVSRDRETRRRAHQAKFDALSESEDDLNTVFDKLVKVRTQMAKKLGYKTFIELGYAKLMRSDFDAEMVAAFREQAASLFVPFVTELLEKQCTRLGVSDLKYFDERVFFATGDPGLKVKTVDEMIGATEQMFKEMSDETGHYFSFMVKNELLDLGARDNKLRGGFIHYIRDYQSPFIFANLNGVSDDVRLLRHESGHGFQFFLNRDQDVPEYLSGTYEVAEIPSMTFELITSPWNHHFFNQEDLAHYNFIQVMGGPQILPYATAIDEFQHLVYAKPDMSPAERNAAWSALEAKYMPARDYEGHPYLEKGTFWHQQAHVFTAPFYYIDYVFASLCALQFWLRDQESHDET
ncbi:MAG TPA: M3 family oligoendopeptidase, partial [Candidatus Angelobacter sp.]|nr:M3 family oligoendopeptidase [Candidatus Angelobacter sp.]